MAVLGIDVSKAEFHCFLLDDGRSAKRSFPNAASGFAAIPKWLGNRRASDVHACMEATGPYWRDLAGSLYSAGLPVSVVNPSQIAHYGRSMLRRTKTDSADAELIAQYCSTRQPPLWEPDKPEILELRGLLSYRTQLIAQRTALRNLESQVHRSDVLRTVHKVQLTTISDSVTSLEKQMHVLVSADAKLREQVDLLLSIPGVGFLTAVTLIAKLPIERLRNAKAAAAYVGITPSDRQSGTSVHGKPRISRTGHAELRRDLFMPALSAMRFNPTLKVFAERLRGKGKAGKVVAVAVMRKLVVLAFALLKKGEKYNAPAA